MDEEDMLCQWCNDRCKTMVMLPGVLHIIMGMYAVIPTTSIMRMARNSVRFYLKMTKSMDSSVVNETPTMNLI